MPGKFSGLLAAYCLVFYSGAAAQIGAPRSHGLAAAYASKVSFKAATTSGAASACDLNSDGKVNVLDVQLIADMTIGTIPCTANIAGANVCNTTVANDVVSTALGGTCPASSVSHSVSLSWAASISPNITGYNVYRGTTSGGPYTKVTATVTPGTSYTDSTVQAATTYYYVVTAVNGSNQESGYSNQAQAVVPSP